MCAQIISRELAKDVKSDGRELLAREESATLWLWAYQELLEWGNGISWMFSPVTGKKKYPGDLWGVDDQGNLILVETKRVSGQSKQDPFLDFVDYEKSAIVPTQKQLIHRSRGLLENEFEFIKKNRSAITTGELQKNFHRGVVPYSSKRSAVRRWIHLYKESIMPQFLNQEPYLRNLEKRLKNYPENNEAVHYVGFLLTGDVQADGLSSLGKRNCSELRKTSGAQRVHLVQITARYEPPDIVRLISKRKSEMDKE